ncbi:MAG: hypothetical protein ABR899_06075, partial [Candidatus Krumholzibacteriaceae bacterium]|jgi:hypothetical protein
MIELKHDRLVFSFPEVHPGAALTIEFERTLRIPDDGKMYPLPPGLGGFPLRHIDDFPGRVPREWLDHGGVMLPMHQSEAMWLSFDSAYLPEHGTPYPFAVKIAAGKIDAVTGEPWTNGLHLPQDYIVAPEQPWLDGFCVEKGVIRQFVAMPLGDGYTAEEQVTGTGEHGGLQIIVYPMKREVFDRRFPRRRHVGPETPSDASMISMAAPPMGLAPGGTMRQEIYEDPYDFEDWNRKTCSRCFVHIANSLLWTAITGEETPTIPMSSREYSAAGLPWFDYYNEGAEALEGSEILKKLKSVIKLGLEKGENPLPENTSTDPGNVIELRKRRSQHRVREGTF